MTKSEFAREMAALVAKSLTPNQRAALLWLPEDGSERRISEADSVARMETGMYGLASRAVIPGVNAVLAQRSNGFGLRSTARWKATPFGLKVRALLAGEG